MAGDNIERLIYIPADSVKLEGVLAMPKGAETIVIFAHGSGSSRHSTRNKSVAKVLQERGIATLLFDLLTAKEDTLYENRFDIDLLTERLKAATRWTKDQSGTRELNIGYFGASTGAAAALRTAAELGRMIRAVVSRGGRPDLAEESLEQVQSPTLLIVGGYDDIVLQLNKKAFNLIKAEKELKIIPGATHLFEEHGKLEEVARLASEWFVQHLTSKTRD